MKGLAGMLQGEGHGGGKDLSGVWTEFNKTW